MVLFNTAGISSESHLASDEERRVGGVTTSLKKGGTIFLNIVPCMDPCLGLQVKTDQKP